MSGAARPTRASTRRAVTPQAPTPTPGQSRTTRSRTGTSSKPSTPIPPAPSTSAKRATTKKAPGVKESTLEPTTLSSSTSTNKPSATKATAPRPTKVATYTDDASREPIMAFLRIRPHLGEDEPMNSPYLIPLSDTSVRMTDPQDAQNTSSRFRLSTLPSSSVYTFSHVFPPDTTQSDFFKRTTLPLVKDVLEGQNALLFTYGVTNSGKTYTVQGGKQDGSAGILPRSLDVIFNSIEGLQGDGRYRPVRLCAIEPADSADSSDLKASQIKPEPTIAHVLGDAVDDVASASDTDIDPTMVTLDRNYEYTIWLSYAEVYNEKVYDLLASVKGENTPTETSGIPRLNTTPLLLSRQALPIKPSPASDHDGDASTGKYISGLRQFRVQSASQAKALVRLGQLHRHVFGTLANRESSRSHGMVIIKVVRGHRGEKDDPTSLQVSRLTLVDLAGSERTKHTQTTGDRLKEAGNINKSLMVLGQCMEVMRSNQRKVAVSLSQESNAKVGRVDTREIKRGLAVIPFRHSRLTEVLMDYFVGDGRTIMIVNVNPYDTGYDENSHVMKFAALAKEVFVTPAPAPVQKIPAVPGALGRPPQGRVREVINMFNNPPVSHPVRRKVTISFGGRGTNRSPSETVLEVLEEDEPANASEDEEDEEPINPLVDALFDEIESLRMQLFEAEMRCAAVEIETREEVMHEMEERMRNMERLYSKRLMNELERNEMKTDAKIDMLHRAGLFASPQKKASAPVNIPTAVKGSANIFQKEQKYAVDYKLDESDDDDSSNAKYLESPTHEKGKSYDKMKARRPSLTTQRPSSSKRRISEAEEAEEGDEEATIPDSEGEGDTIGSNDDDEEEDEEEEDEDDSFIVSDGEVEYEEEESLPPSPPRKSNKGKADSKNKEVGKSAAKSSSKSHVSNLAEKLGNLQIDEDEDEVPIRKAKGSRNIPSPTNDDDEDGMEIEGVAKKKKRRLVQRSVVTQDEIERTTYEVENHVSKAGGTKPIRRLARES
ncbi:hypothetical protein AX16_005563 [Volvariella volvacea WC 439]|nr:hypothetical protein AX16_005563 [Volvariella volvacea WC 439]